MEQVLEIYEKPCDPERPVVCMDEQPVQLVDSRAGYRGSSATRRLRVRAGGHRLHVLRGPVLLAPGDGPQAQDEGGLGRRGRQPAGGPLRGLRAPSCATTSTLTRRERSTKRPARARELVKRIEFCYTPKHGSWLNIAENELRTRQCLRHRRLGDLETLQAEAWSVDVNERQRGVDWQMKVDDARCKLKSVYPKIIL